MQGAFQAGRAVIESPVAAERRCDAGVGKRGKDMGTSADVIKGLYKAFATGDVPTVLGGFDAKIEWNEAEGFLYADGNPYIGPQAVAEGVFQRIAADIDQFSVAAASFIDGGDAVVVEGRYKGTMKATSTPVDAQFAHVWHLRNGKVVRFQQYTDTAQWKAAAGA
jgi:ketosteroid isomerase-like protein